MKIPTEYLKSKIRKHKNYRRISEKQIFTLALIITLSFLNTSITHYLSISVDTKKVLHIEDIELLNLYIINTDTIFIIIRYLILKITYKEFNYHLFVLFVIQIFFTLANMYLIT
ncbi:hypothetical protein VT25_07240 [Photobacterium leiognathi subsp. mandapamensis]|nr:hypothetical protein VT25_07240 [Photobacterium leiognathi subsp. mandapamensis]